MEAIGVGIFFLLFFGLWVGVIVLYIWGIVDVCRLPDHQFRAAGTDKTMWILIVVLVGGIGTIVWYYAKRKDVLAAAGRQPFAPPGWYPEPGTGGLRWWDGVQWTEARHAPPPPG